MSARKGFRAEAEARLARAGNVSGSLTMRHAPAMVIQNMTRAHADTQSACSGRLEVEGHISSPGAPGRIVRIDASLNGKDAGHAQSAGASVNWRSLLNIDSDVGERHTNEMCQHLTDKLAEQLCSTLCKYLQAAQINRCGACNWRR